MNATDQLAAIVMVEDDEGHARLIARNIRRAGAENEIVHARTGEEGLVFLLGAEGNGACHAGRPMLLLLDLNLPDMSGLDVLATIRRTAHLKRLMVIILTTTDNPAEIRRCYDLGANVYVTKPMEYDAFVNAIRQLGLFLSVVTLPEVA